MPSTMNVAILWSVNESSTSHTIMSFFIDLCDIE